MKKIVFLFFVLFHSAFADSYFPINDGKLALQARVDYIYRAQKTLELTYFEWYDDKTGNLLLALLRDASRRGVEVRLILDGIFHGVPKSTLETLKLDGVEIREFNPFRLFSITSWSRRMHNKLFIVDGETLIMGSRNIGDGYYEKGDYRYLDIDVVIKGDVARQAQDYFSQLWEEPHVVEKQRKLSQKKFIKATTKLDKALESLDSHPFLLRETQNSYEGEDIELVSIFLDEVELYKKKQTRPVYDALVDLINNAQESVEIEMGIILMKKSFFTLFRNAVDRGVKVKILTNSILSTKTLEPFAGYVGWRKDLVRAGIELYEYVGNYEIHSKSAVIDGKVAVIGSFNLDSLSVNLSTEVISVAYDEKVARDLQEIIQHNLQLAVKIDENGKQIKDGMTIQRPSLRKRLKTKVLRFFIVPFFKKYI